MSVSALVNEEIEIVHGGAEDDEDAPRPYEYYDNDLQDIQPTQIPSLSAKDTSVEDREDSPEPEPGLPWESLWASLPHPTGASVESE